MASFQLSEYGPRIGYNAAYAEKANSLADTPQVDCTCRQENTEMMDEFYSERDALESAARKAYHAKIELASEKFHIEPKACKSLREYIEAIKAGEYIYTDEELDAELSHWDSRRPRVEVRKHKPDEKGYNVFIEKLGDELNLLKMDIRSLTPEVANPKVHEFIRKTVH